MSYERYKLMLHKICNELPRLNDVKYKLNNSWRQQICAVLALVIKPITVNVCVTDNDRNTRNYYSCEPRGIPHWI